MILTSRTGSTGALVDAIGSLAPSERPPVLVNASGIDYTGSGEGEVDENAAPGTSFLAGVCVEWEAAARRAEEHGVRVVCMRTPLVIARDALALRLMALPFRLFAGGPLGNGRQWFPWVHMTDAVDVYRRALDDESLSGVLNMVAPEVPRQREAARDLGRGPASPVVAAGPGAGPSPRPRRAGRPAPARSARPLDEVRQLHVSLHDLRRGGGRGLRPEMNVARFRPWFFAAAVYNLVWGATFVLAPGPVVRTLGVAHPDLTAWRVVGMLVLVYAPAYWWAARSPSQHAHLIAIATLGKILGPLGFVWAAASGALPLRFGLTIVTNDLVWLPAFVAYLRARPATPGSRSSYSASDRRTAAAARATCGSRPRSATTAAAASISSTRRRACCLLPWTSRSTSPSSALAQHRDDLRAQPGLAARRVRRPTGSRPRRPRAPS